MIANITIVGAGNGGKAAAADLTIQGKRVRLFEFPEYQSNVEEIIKSRTLAATGAVAGQATLDNRYFNEDIGMGLVMFCSLGKFVGVPTPTCEVIVRMGEILSGIDYFAQGIRTIEALGLAALDLEGLKSFLETGEILHA